MPEKILEKFVPIVKTGTEVTIENYNDYLKDVLNNKSGQFRDRLLDPEIFNDEVNCSIHNFVKVLFKKIEYDFGRDHFEIAKCIIFESLLILQYGIKNKNNQILEILKNKKNVSKLWNGYLKNYPSKTEFDSLTPWKLHLVDFPQQCRIEKEEGKWGTYKQAYENAANTYSFKGKRITANQLKNTVDNFFIRQKT